MALSEERVRKLREEDALEKARLSALRLISIRPRSTEEVRRRLEKQGFAAEEIDIAVMRLRESGLLGDAAFASAWVDNRTTFRPRGRRLLTLELRQKGVDGQTIEQVMQDLPDEESLAYESGLRAAKRLAGEDWETFRRKLSGSLGRKGFSYETVATVVRRIWQEMHADPARDDEYEEMNQ